METYVSLLSDYIDNNEIIDNLKEKFNFIYEKKGLLKITDFLYYVIIFNDIKFFIEFLLKDNYYSNSDILSFLLYSDFVFVETILGFLIFCSSDEYYNYKIKFDDDYSRYESDDIIYTENLYKLLKDKISVMDCTGNIKKTELILRKYEDTRILGFITNVICNIVYNEVDVSDKYKVYLRNFEINSEKIVDRMFNTQLNGMFNSHHSFNIFNTYDDFILIKKFNYDYKPKYIKRIIDIYDDDDLFLINKIDSIEEQMLYVENLPYEQKEALLFYTKNGDELINLYLRDEYFKNKIDSMITNEDNFEETFHDQLKTEERIELNYLLNEKNYKKFEEKFDIKYPDKNEAVINTLYLVKYLNIIFKNAPYLKKKIKTFRHVNTKYNTNMKHLNYISTSILEGILGGKYLYEILINKNVKCLPLLNLSFYNEYEILIDKERDLECEHDIDGNFCEVNFGSKKSKKLKKKLKSKKLKKFELKNL